MNDYDAAQLASVRDPDRPRLHADARQGPEDLLPGMWDDSDLIGGWADTDPGYVGPRDGCTFLHRHKCAGTTCDGADNVPNDDDPFADPAPTAGGLDGSPGPWVTARFDGECSRGCAGIEEGQEIRADGDDGWECRDCVMKDQGTDLSWREVAYGDEVYGPEPGGLL